ncbi:hypothetical protein D3C72_1998180 [compost metagenome]
MLGAQVKVKGALAGGRQGQVGVGRAIGGQERVGVGGRGHAVGLAELELAQGARAQGDCRQAQGADGIPGALQGLAIEVETLLDVKFHDGIGVKRLACVQPELVGPGAATGQPETRVVL